MEQNNSQIGGQSTGPSPVSGTQNGGGNNDQGAPTPVSAAGGSSAAAGGDVGSAAAAAAGDVGSAAAAGGDVGSAAAATAGGDVGSAAAAAACGDVGSAAGGGSSSQFARGKKRVRHNQHQINELEVYFKDYPNPDRIQRNEVARRIGLDPAQVKCWFQNKRAQLKTQSERKENEALRSENHVLQAHTQHYKEALMKNTWPNYGLGGSRQSVEDKNLRLENIRLREEAEKLKSTITRLVAGQNSHKLPVTFPIITQNSQNSPITFPSIISQNTDNLSITFQDLQNLPIMTQNHPIISQTPQNLPIMYQNQQNLPILSKANNASAYPGDQAIGYASTSATSSGQGLNSINVRAPGEFSQSITELVVSAAEELKVMAIAVEPLWIPNSDDGATTVLNKDEYRATYPDNFGPTRLGYSCEASRHISRVLLNPTQLLNILMNANEWSVMFSPIVSSAVTVEVLSEGIDYNAALHVIAAEYHIPTPLVPNRQSYFARYCTQHCEGVWAVVDVSLDNIIPTLEIMTCQKRPSGCLIQEMSDGTSKITWIEHVYVDNNGVSNMYKDVLLSGLGFGAQRWVSILERQFQRHTTAIISANVLSTDLNNLLMLSPEGRKGILKIAERMVNSFIFGITGPKGGKWTKVYENFGDDIRLMSTRVMDDPGLPNGTLLSVSTSFPLSLAPNMVFDFFRDHRSRKEWDVFANGNEYEPVCRISYGEEASNCVSIYKVPITTSGHMLVVQESWSDPVASHVVFAPTEIGTIDMMLGGRNPNCIPLLPSGFTILPDGTSGSSGTLLTVSFQVLMNKSPAVDINVVAVSKVARFLRCICDKIKLALGAFAPHT